ncbi:MAG: hypothetical protein ACLFWB_04345 [Armatimonadota bacterium]
MWKSPGGSITADLVVIIGLAALMLAFWGTCIFGHDVPVAGIYQQHFAPYAEGSAPELTRQWDSLLWDSVAQFYPWRMLAHRSFTEFGEFPLWNPHQLCGTPFVGNGQSALFYPPHWILGLTDTATAMGIINALHYFLAALFVFLLVRTLGGDLAASALAGLAYAFGGFMVTWTELPSLMETATWLPAGLLGVEWLFRGRMWRGAALTALALGCAILAGHFQIAAYVWMVTIGSALVHCVYWASARRKRQRMAPYRATAIGLVVAVVLGAGFGAIQLLPTMELGANSPRGGGELSAEGYRFHLQRSMAPVELKTIVDPDFLGSPVDGDYPGVSYSEHCAYLGTIAFIGIILALIWGRRNRHIMLYGGIAVLALWTALGGLPSYAYYFWLPKVGLAGGFSRLLSVFTCAGAVVAGLGYTALIKQFGKKERRWASGLLWILVAYALFRAVPWAYEFNPRTPVEKLYPETEITTTLQQLDGRVLAVTEPEDWTLQELPEALLPPNSATVYGYDSINGYDSLFTKTYRQYANRVQGGIASPAANGNMVLISKPFAAPDAACEYYVSQASISTETLDVEPGRIELIYNGPGGYIYRDRAAAAYAVETDGVASGVHDNPVIPAHRAGMNRIYLLDYPRGRARIAEGYYPGWIGMAQGQARPVQPADGVFMSISGFNQKNILHLCLLYYPASVAFGGFLTLLAIAAAAALFTARCIMIRLP